jgi:heme exporter protein C
LEELKQSLKILFALAMAAVTFWGFAIPATTSPFPEPDLARMLFFHLPCAIMTSLLVFFAPYLAVRYLRHKTPDWDVRCTAANELGFLFGLLTMATGILFSRVQWQAWWSWDPRQTSFLLVLLIYGAYFVLRAAIADDVKRAANSAAYCVVTTLPTLFLIFVMPRILFSLHPSDTLTGGKLEGDYRYVFLAMLVLFSVLTVWLYKLRVRAGLAELALENLNGNLEASGGSAASTGVVRPVPVSRES